MGCVSVVPEYIHLDLPQPPSLNEYLRKFRGRMVKTAAAKAYQEAVWMLSSKWRPPEGGPVYHGDVALTLKWWRRLGQNGRYQGDVDNYLKVLLDAMQGAVYKNDAQISELHVYRMPDSGNGGRVLVDVSAR